MARHGLRAIIALGLLISVVSGMGVLAVFTDRATTGTNDVTSGELGRAADLKIAMTAFRDPQSFQPVDCGSYSDDLQTGLFSFTANGGTGDVKTLCVRNDGQAPLDLTVSVFDLLDIDVDCTGDEAAFGDTTCGGNQAGELSPVLTVRVQGIECDTNQPSALVGSSKLDALVGTPIGLGTLAPSAILCFDLSVTYGSFDVSEVAQSDKSTWRFAFDGTAS